MLLPPPKPSFWLMPARGPLKKRLPTIVVCMAFAWNQALDCFSKRPISLTTLWLMVVCRGKSPPVASNPNVPAPERIHVINRPEMR